MNSQCQQTWNSLHYSDFLFWILRWSAFFSSILNAGKYGSLFYWKDSSCTRIFCEIGSLAFLIIWSSRCQVETSFMRWLPSQLLLQLLLSSLKSSKIFLYSGFCKVFHMINVMLCFCTDETCCFDLELVLLSWKGVIGLMVCGTGGIILQPERFIGQQFEDKFAMLWKGITDLISISTSSVILAAIKTNIPESLSPMISPWVCLNLSQETTSQFFPPIVKEYSVTELVCWWKQTHQWHNGTAFDP